MEYFENSGLGLRGKIYGSGPVQAEGSINGFPFYFRARYDGWTFAISENPKICPVDIQFKETGEEYGYFAEGCVGKEWEYLASYMEVSMVKDIITKCAGGYLKSKL